MRTVSRVLVTMAAMLALAPPMRGQNSPSPAATPKTGKSQIIGVVVDSVHHRFLSGADVQVEGLKTALQTDSVGRFEIDSVPPGTYQVGVFHAVLDTLDVTLLTRPFHVGPDSAVVVVLAVPSAATIIKRTCPAGSNPAGSAVVGHVTNPETFEPIARAEVSVAWTEFEVSKQVGIRRTPHLERDSTDSAGAFQICGLPSSLNATIQARRGSAITGEIPIVLGDGASQLFARTLSLPPGDSAAKTGNATVSGVVLLDKGADNAGTRLELTGTDAVAFTNEKGEFTMRNLPPGSRTLLARRLGFSAETVPVDLSSHQPQRVTIKLTRFVAVMDPVLVTARRVMALDKVGFNQRQRTGFGHYIGPERIERMNAYQVTDILRRVPGLRIISTPQGDVVTSSRAGSIMGEDCVQYYVDDMPWMSFTPGDVNMFVAGHEVVAVEVYQGPGTPAQFIGSRPNCVTIVLWTRFKIRS